MKRLIILGMIATGLLLNSCSKKTPEFVNSIPDDAIGVVSLNPMQIHTKGKLNTIESLKEKFKDEIWGQILEDPLSTGLQADEYVFIFAKMEEEGPVIGVVGGMKDREKFESMLGKIKEGISSGFKTGEGYTYMQPDDKGIIAWNDEQMIVLASPDGDQLETSYYLENLDWMFHPVKEESITSLVNFKEYLGNLKDLNFWVSSDDMWKVLKEVAPEKMQIDIPVELYNNYGQLFVEFDNGAVKVTGETFFSEEVEKNVEEFLVMNPMLNQDMLKLAPGGDLLLAFAGSMDMDKLRKLITKFAPPEVDSVGNKIEAATGIPAEELLNAFTGDFTIAINGVEGEPMIPVELFLGFGVNSDAIQEKLMSTVESMAPVQRDSTFFTINIQGNEIYSGILNDMWVITNSKGYKDAVTKGSHPASLVQSRFKDFSDGSLGMYMNLDLERYPSAIRDLLSQKPEQSQWVKKLTGPFDYMGFSYSNHKGNYILKTNTPSENSLYTLVKMAQPE